MSEELVSEAKLPQAGETISDRYRVESLLGRGGFGAVFAGRNVATNRRVAIKWLLPQLSMDAEAMGRFMAEAKVTASIEHPNVVAIYDVGKDQRNSPFIVMELLNGESLRERLLRDGRLAPIDAARLLLPAITGVAAAHREGVVHRDLKPDNIFLCRDKDDTELPTKVVDFGISKLFDSDDGLPSHTRTGMVIGTPQYMTPEQLDAPKTADPRFDVYAMGVVFYETLTGRCPYDGQSVAQLVPQILAGSPPPMRVLAPDIHPALEALVLKAMHRRIDHRFASMAEMRTALAKLRDEGQLKAPVGEVVAPLGGDTQPLVAPGSGPGAPLGSAPGAPLEPGLAGVVPTLPTPSPQPFASTLATPSPQSFGLGVVTPAQPDSGSMISPSSPGVGSMPPAARAFESTEEPKRSPALPLAIGGVLVALLATGLGAAALLFDGTPTADAPPADVSVETPALEVAAAAVGEPPDEAAAAESPREPEAARSSVASPTFAQASSDVNAHRYESLTVVGFVYETTSTEVQPSFRLALTEGCEQPLCTVWVRSGAVELPVAETTVEVTGRVLGERRFQSAGGDVQEMLEVDAVRVRPRPLVEPPEIGAEHRLTSTAPRPRAEPSASRQAPRGRSTPVITRPGPTPTPLTGGSRAPTTSTTRRGPIGLGSWD